VARPVELLQQGSKAELWQMCCGFIDLSTEQFMAVQKRLLLEQIGLLKGCQLGRKVMRGAMPETIDEFREQVPLTTYADYCPEVQERRDHALPSKAVHWVRTSGYSGTYDIKWVPWPDSFAQEVEKACAASILFALARERGDMSQVREHWKVLYTIGGPEYATGILGYLTQQAFNFEYLPSTPGELTFTERIRAGFAEALYKGLDGFGGLPSVLVTVGQQMKEQPRKPDVTFLREHPKALLRLAKGLAKSKLARRSMLPKDLWDIKAIIGGGTDSAVFSRTVEEMWGKRPLELYGGTEGGLYAIQTWDYEGMTFVPTLNFFEFIPEDEHFKWQIDPSYQPKTILLDEVRPGRNYEIVITNLHGGALVRFRLGDMITINSLRNEKLNIDIPQMMFYGRADYLIDIAGLGRLTERIIWEAIENTGIPYVDWTAHKETRDGKAVLHVYVEPRHKDGLSEPLLATSISRELNRLDSKYHHNPYNIYDDETVANTAQHDSSQIEVTLLPQGAFSNYIAQRQAEGADLGHLKPPHINPSQKALLLLGEVEVPAQPERSVAAVQ
jgi:hypothetical protein